MRAKYYVVAGAITAAFSVGYLGLSSTQANGDAAPVLKDLPSGYRDWRLISVAHEEGNLNDIRAILGNDIAIKAFRKGTLPLPDGAIITRLAWNYVPSEQNNKAFGRNQSFVAGATTNVQFMVKDSKKYASSGGWGFAQFNGGRPVEEAALGGCFACHAPGKAQDYIFTHYSP